MQEGSGLEHIRAHVYFVDAALLGRGILLLDNPNEGSGGVSHDPAQADGVCGDRGAEQAGGLQFCKAAEQARDALRPQHRRIAADDHDGAMGIRCALTEPLFDQRGGRGHGFAGATLLLLGANDTPGRLATVSTTSAAR